MLASGAKALVLGVGENQTPLSLSKKAGNKLNFSSHGLKVHKCQKRQTIQRALESEESRAETSSQDNDEIKPAPRRRRQSKVKPSSDVSNSESSGEESGSESTGSVKKRTTRKPRAKKTTTKKKTAADSLEEGVWGEEGKYGWPPLVVCLGNALTEFVPSVRPNMDERHDNPDQINTWKATQWSPPEFARTPGGPSSNVAIALGRMEARVGFMGKLGDDEEGRRLKSLMWENRVMVDGIILDKKHKTAIDKVKVVEREGKISLEISTPCASDSLLEKDIDTELLEEARIIHVTTSTFIAEPARSTVIKALTEAKKRGSLIFLDLSLPLHLWNNTDEAFQILKPVWLLADVIKGSQPEIEYLVNETYFLSRREASELYAAPDQHVVRAMGNIFHYEKEEMLPLLTKNVKLLIVTNGTWSVHYFSPTFDGYVAGAEDVLLSPYHCDRTGSGDAMSAAFLRRLSLDTSIIEEEDKLRRAIRFAIAAGIVSQWVTGSIKSFPTENAATNMAAQIYDLTSI